MTSRLLELASQARALGASRVSNAVQADTWYRVENTTGDRAVLSIYGPIGSFDDPDSTNAAGFTRALRDITAPTIDLHINSPGGLVFDGVAIYSALRNHAATVDVHVDGVAASAASFVAMAGDTVTVEKPARMMIHDARGLVLGNADDMRQMVTLLDELSDTIAGIYADRAGGDTSAWRDRMRAETWFNAEQAVEAGLADRVNTHNKTATPDNLRGQTIRARARVTLRKG